MRLSDALRVECKPLGIQVLLVAPGFIDTNARNTAKVRQLGRCATLGCWLLQHRIRTARCQHARPCLTAAAASYRPSVDTVWTSQ